MQDAAHGDKSTSICVLKISAEQVLESESFRSLRTDMGETMSAIRLVSCLIRFPTTIQVAMS